MTLVNQTISHYKIVSLLGEGGMGEVYRARDTKLGRDVAIKVLPAAFSADAERLRRFEQEAQAAGALNHPNILVIFHIGMHDGAPYIISELLEGQTLRERMAGAALPQRKAMDYALQIAHGLAAAHAKGIVHRDLKPENLFVTNDGRVKILDFGLAKLTGTGDETQSQTEVPTRKVNTDPGMVMGTMGYMSPEQLKGRPADHRSDIFSFGAILYEMLSGKRAFRGDSMAETMSAILREDPPDLSETNKTVSPALERVVHHCLEKSPEERFHSARDLAFAIESLSGTATSSGQTSTMATFPALRPRTRERLGWAVAGVLLVAAIVLAVLHFRSLPTSSRQLTLTIMPPAGIRLRLVGTMGSTPHISPDGSAVMFVTDEPRRLYVRRLDSLDLLQVPGSDTVVNEPFWHESVAVSFPSFSARQLLGVRLPDGAPETLIPLERFSRGGSWSDTGTLLVSELSHLVTRKPDGTAVSITIPDNRDGELVYPEFLPGSEDFLIFFKPKGGEGEVWLATLSQGAVTKPTVLFKNDTAARYTPWDGGRVLFVRTDNLYSQRLNRSIRAVECQAELLVRGVASQPGLMRADFSVAQDGTVAWRPGRAALSEVTVFDRKGSVLGAAGPPGAIETVFVSPSDDSRLLVTGTEAWLVNVGQSARVALPRDTQWFNWSPDGARVLGLSEGSSLVARPADSISSIDRIGQLPQGSFYPRVLSPDGKFILGRLPHTGAARWVRLSDLAAGVWTPLVGSDELLNDLSFSPDGRFVFYSGPGIYVQPFPGPGRRQLIDERGIDPVWRGDGKEIVFVRDNAVWSVAVTGSAGTPTFGAPERLFEGVRRAPSAVGQSQGLAVSRDGSRFFLVQGLEQPDTNVIHVMTPTTQRPR
jgi:serine/threonine protein kinase/WD40 repeat protein